MLPVGVMALGGLIASFFSVYPGSGLVAVVQDLFFLAWSTTVVTICRTPGGLSAVLRTWAYASVVWAGLMLVGALANIDVLSGITAREGNRASITFGDPNLAAGYFASSLMIVWASATPRRRIARVAAGAVLHRGDRLHRLEWFLDRHPCRLRGGGRHRHGPAVRRRPDDRGCLRQLCSWAGRSAPR